LRRRHCCVVNHQYRPREHRLRRAHAGIDRVKSIHAAHDSLKLIIFR
jgi:hypothetical protein